MAMMRLHGGGRIATSSPLSPSELARIVLAAPASQCDIERVFSAAGLVTGKLRTTMGIDNLLMLVLLMKNINQKEEWGRFKTGGIGGNNVRGRDWRPASDVMSEETYLDSLYDSTLIKSAMKDNVGLAFDELDDMSSDEDDATLRYPFQDVHEDEDEDEDDD